MQLILQQTRLSSYRPQLQIRNTMLTFKGLLCVSHNLQEILSAGSALIEIDLIVART